jgi:hypothetical protein
MNRVYLLLLSTRLVRGLLRVVRTRRSRCTRSRDRNNVRVAFRYHASGINKHLTGPSADFYGEESDNIIVGKAGLGDGTEKMKELLADLLQAVSLSISSTLDRDSTKQT